MKSKKQKCCICNKEFIGFGNNPYPLKEKGRCCDECNYLVLVERLKVLEHKNKMIKIIDEGRTEQHNKLNKELGFKK